MNMCTHKERWTRRAVFCFHSTCSWHWRGNEDREHRETVFTCQLTHSKRWQFHTIKFFILNIFSVSSVFEKMYRGSTVCIIIGQVHKVSFTCPQSLNANNTMGAFTWGPWVFKKLASESVVARAHWAAAVRRNAMWGMEGGFHTL